MLPDNVKITLFIISALVQMFAISVSLRNWYSACLSISKNAALVVVFLPLIVGILILTLFGLGVLPTSLTDEAWTIGSLIGTALLFISTAQQFRGKCKVKIDP